MTKTIGLYWFTQDLRIDDNPLLQRASQEVDMLICLYCIPDMTRFLTHYAQENQFGAEKLRFLSQSLYDLSESLNALDQRLVITTEPPLKTLANIIEQYPVTHLYGDYFAGSDERHIWQQLEVAFPSLVMTQDNVHSLYRKADLPFSLASLPATFTQFRKQMEAQPKLPVNIAPPLSGLPKPFDVHIENTILADDLAQYQEVSDSPPALFDGGEQAGLAHARRYFASSLPQEYKQTRNDLDGMDYSTKLSPWLALGCLSPHTVLARLAEHERQFGANDSTYWISFELLWREYFYWSALKNKTSLFQFAGNKSSAPLTSFYAQRFLQWKRGETPFPIVNACMHQLKQTGYMSNRGRQIVASCLIHELQLDWRYGAAYFETQLVDYDVASNWGNWQYLAGVGADPRGSRRFDLDKQTQQYDANLVFIDRWQGHCAAAQLNSVDMVDWPICHPMSNEEPL